GVVGRLAHATVVERLLLVVDAEVPDVHARLLEEADLRVAFELADVVGGDADDQVELPREELGEARLVLDDRPEHDALELHGKLPVARVLLEHDALAAIPARELEGPGAHRPAWIVET